MRIAKSRSAHTSSACELLMKWTSQMIYLLQKCKIHVY